jgi:hypothetical protein
VPGRRTDESRPPRRSMTRRGASSHRVREDRPESAAAPRSPTGRPAAIERGTAPGDVDAQHPEQDPRGSSCASKGHVDRCARERQLTNRHVLELASLDASEGRGIESDGSRRSVDAQPGATSCQANLPAKIRDGTIGMLERSIPRTLSARHGSQRVPRRSPAAHLARPPSSPATSAALRLRQHQEQPRRPDCMWMWRSIAPWVY